MILLEVDCNLVNNEFEFSRLLRDKITEIEYCYCNTEDLIYYQDCNNLNAFWDDLGEFNFHDYPTKIVIYNFEKVKSFWNDNINYDRVKNTFDELNDKYGDDLIVELYEHEIEKPTECVTLKFVKLDREYGNEEEQRNYEANCNE